MTLVLMVGAPDTRQNMGHGHHTLSLTSFQGTSWNIRYASIWYMLVLLHSEKVFAVYGSAGGSQTPYGAGTAMLHARYTLMLPAFCSNGGVWVCYRTGKVPPPGADVCH
eukprot:GHUV01056250.1.p1 GENE.GHUV01056250.1~~GHUV01056250.1.p1  ORF type:complete len:109 (-),score=6.27 GHUV01056250.1:77-403(-)